jgi:hypothetical protein
MGDVNTPVGTDVAGEVWNDGALPAQGFGDNETLMPGIDTFLLPQNLAQLWDTVDAVDTRPGSPTNGQTVKRLRLKFDKNSPLVISEGPKKGETLTATVTGVARARGKKDDPQTPWVSDLAYLLEIGCGDQSRPKTAQALQAQINKYAGKPVRIEHGLSAHCRPDKVRYIYVEDGSNKTALDPAGTKGCGDDGKQREDKKGKKGRYYTRDFKDAENGGQFVDQIECECGAALRGFPSLERFVPPIGAGQK